MFPSKMLLAALILLSLFGPADVWGANSRGVRRRPASLEVVKKPRRLYSRTEFGLGYTLWNERLAANNGTNRQDGFAGYGGFVATLERNWIRYRWQWGGNVSFSIGKVTAGGVSTVLPEGRDRPWYAASISPFFNYRFNVHFMGGLGALLRYRAVDWTTIDSNTKVESTSRLQATVSLNMRWVSGRYTFLQSFAPLNFEGDTLWTWGLQYSL